MLSEITKYKYFNILDLKSAYHQIEVNLKDKPYMVFDACGPISTNFIWNHKQCDQLPKGYR